MGNDLQRYLDAYDVCGSEPLKFLSAEFIAHIDSSLPDKTHPFRIAMLTGYFIRCAEGKLRDKVPNAPEPHVVKLLVSDREKKDKIKDIADFLDKHDRLGLQDKISNYSLVSFDTTQSFFEVMAQDHIRDHLDRGVVAKEGKDILFEATYRNMAFGYLYKLSEELVENGVQNAESPNSGQDESPLEEELYRQVWQELDEGTTDKGLWAKLLVDNDGDEERTKISYLKIRVERLRNQSSIQRAEPKASKQKILEKQDFDSPDSNKKNTRKKQVVRQKTTAKRSVSEGKASNKDPGRSKEVRIDMTFVGPGDEFFMMKINRGSTGKEKLSKKERAFLFTRIDQLLDYGTPGDQFSFKTDNLSPAKARQLTKKCVKALTVAYKKDTSGKNKKEALTWNEFNEWQYENSVCVISGVVQDWYLTEGRPLEKKVVSLFGNPDW